jgi:hypothetical protein
MWNFSTSHFEPLYFVLNMKKNSSDTQRFYENHGKAEYRKIMSSTLASYTGCR